MIDGNQRRDATKLWRFAKGTNVKLEGSPLSLRRREPGMTQNPDLGALAAEFCLIEVQFTIRIRTLTLICGPVGTPMRRIGMNRDYSAEGHLYSAIVFQVS